MHYNGNKIQYILVDRTANFQNHTQTDQASTIHNYLLRHPNCIKSTATETFESYLQFICFDRDLNRSPRVPSWPDKLDRPDGNPSLGRTTYLSLQKS